MKKKLQAPKNKTDDRSPYLKRFLAKRLKSSAIFIILASDRCEIIVQGKWERFTPTLTKIKKIQLSLFISQFLLLGLMETTSIKLFIESSSLSLSRFKRNWPPMESWAFSVVKTILAVRGYSTLWFSSRKKYTNHSGSCLQFSR